MNMSKVNPKGNKSREKFLAIFVATLIMYSIYTHIPIVISIFVSFLIIRANKVASSKSKYFHEFWVLGVFEAFKWIGIFLIAFKLLYLISPELAKMIILFSF